MSKVNQIQSALKAIDQANFQKLCDHYLHKLGYNDINAIGSVPGKDKTKVGTPDTYVPRADGKYLFAEYTTQQEGVFAKFEEDIAKCLDTAKTGLSRGAVERIILCYNGQLDVADHRRLRDHGYPHDCEIEPIGIGRLSLDLYERYPGLAKEYLGIDVDTRQIVDEEQFVSMYQRHQSATRLDTTFLGRESELASALESLEQSDVLLITGAPGVGKTRFALECCRRFLAGNDAYEAHYVLNRWADIYQDVRTRFAAPGRCLIMIDDANRLTGLVHFLELLREQGDNRSFKFVCTVRGYVSGMVRSVVEGYCKPGELEVQRFTDEEIRALVRTEYNIQNGDYLNRIERLSGGNPRLAMMAGRIAVEKNTLESINDVSALYDEYFKSIRDDVEGVGDPDLMRAAAVVTFFRGIDRENAEQMELILEAFGMDMDTFWRHVERLHELEIVDLWENHSIARIADQVLANYLFWRAVFVDRVVDLVPVLTQLFPRFRQRLMDAINAVYSAFDERLVADVLRPCVLATWDQFIREENESALWELMEAFWWLNDVQTLILVRGHIDALESEHTDMSKIEWKSNSAVVRQSPLSVLSQFRWSSDPHAALELILQYVGKKPSTYGNVIHILTDDYGFRSDSYRYGYQVEQMVVGVVWDEWESSRQVGIAQLFVAVANDFIKTHHMMTGSQRRNTVSWVKFDLTATEELRALRQTMLQRLVELYGHPELTESVTVLLETYPRMGSENAGIEIGTWDMEILLPFVRGHLDPGRYRHCVMVQRLLERCRREDIAYDVALEATFTNPTYELGQFLADDRGEILEYGYEEYRERQRGAIRDRFSPYSFEDYLTFFQQCSEILATTDNNYQIKERVSDVLIDLLDRDADLFEPVILHYLKNGDPLEIGPSRLVSRMMEVYGAERTRAVVIHASESIRDGWLFAFYESLPAVSVTADDVRKLRDLYAKANAQAMPYRFAYLEKFNSADPRIANDIIAVILQRGGDDKRFIACFSSIFWLAGDAREETALLGMIDSDTIERAYVAAADIDQHLDYQSRAMSIILDRDSDFLNKYIRHRYATTIGHYCHEERDYRLLWERNDYIEIMKGALREAFGLNKGMPFYLSDVRDRILMVSSPASDERSKPHERVLSLLEEVLDEYCADREYVEFLSDGIARFDEETRRRLLSHFLRRNQNPADFQSLWIEPSSHSWSGSAIPMYIRQKEFLRSLLPLVCGVAMLDHREYLERRIEALERQIEAEKRREFLEE